MTIILTEKARIEQVKGGLWRTQDNLLAMLDNGKIVIVPRNFLTDNITFINSDFADVRASHIHDVGCKYKELVYVDLTLKELRTMGFLQPRLLNNKQVFICEDIPIEYLSVEKINFKEINDIFKECLIACGENILKSKIMWLAVHCNVGWLFGKKQHIDLNKFYGGEW